MPNGDIVGYHFHIMYKLYPDEIEYTVREKFLDKMISNVYVLKEHIYPGNYFNILLSSIKSSLDRKFAIIDEKRYFPRQYM